MIVGDLFSGIGGFSLAAEWMGWRTAWFSEIDPFASRVLAHHWPDVPNLGDITAIDFTTVEPVDVLTAGFPCQPHSLAGKRQGSNDERDLFDEIIRAAGVLRPRYIVLENVPGLFTSDAGRFFGRVLGAVAALGYDASWRVLSAADVGAPHRRERVWIVAHATGARLQGRERSGTAGTPGRSNGHATERGESVEHAVRSRGESKSFSPSRIKGRADVDNHASERLGGWPSAIRVRGADGTVRLIPREAATGGPQSALCVMVDGFPRDLAGQHLNEEGQSLWPVALGVEGRVAKLRGIGNAIVPQCAVEIFRSIDGRHTARVMP